MPNPVALVREVDFHLTNRCNLSCAHCSVDSGPGRTSWAEMPAHVWEQVIDSAASLECRVADFTGGEPLAYSGLPQLVRRAANRGMRVQVQTNGILAKAGNLASLRDAGLNTVVVSLDGGPATHDAIRGRSGSTPTVCGFSDGTTGS